MLYLIGMGLEEGDMSIKGIEAIKKCSRVFTDVYTSIPYKIFGEKATREVVESNFLIELAKNEDVALVVPGDPIFATTHLALFREAVENGIEVEVIHAPSIINAISRTGLSSYKFGRIVTISREIAKSDIERINNNMKNNLHTLCLFDPAVDPLVCLHNLSFVKKEIIVCSKLGTKEEEIFYGKIEEVKKLEKPACAIVPGDLQFYEEEFLKIISKVRSLQQ